MILHSLKCSQMPSASRILQDSVRRREGGPEIRDANVIISQVTDFFTLDNKQYQ